MELKLLAMIMGEAVRLGHADANPLVSLKLRRDKSPKKPELTDKEIGEIREAAMRLVNHSSELIHQVYQREKVEDVAQWRDAVQFPV